MSKVGALVPETVDIILPVHRGSRWVMESVRSVQEQSWPHWRLAVVGAVGVDDTLELVRSSVDDARLVFFPLPAPQQPVRSRKQAIERMEGSFLAFIDQDDRWRPDKLELQVAWLLDHPEFSAVHGDVRYIDAQGAEIRGADGENRRRADIGFNRLSPKEQASLLFVRNPVRLVSSMLRRTGYISCGGFEDRLQGGEDWALWVSLSATGHRLGHLARILIDRRLHESNLSRVERFSRLESQRRAIELMLTRFPELSMLRTAREEHLNSSSA